MGVLGRPHSRFKLPFLNDHPLLGQQSGSTGTVFAPSRTKFQLHQSSHGKAEAK